MREEQIPYLKGGAQPVQLVHVHVHVVHVHARAHATRALEHFEEEEQHTDRVDVERERVLLGQVREVDEARLEDDLREVDSTK